MSSMEGTSIELVLKPKSWRKRMYTIWTKLAVGFFRSWRGTKNNILHAEERGFHLHGELLEFKILVDEVKDFLVGEDGSILHLVDILKPQEPGEVNVDRKKKHLWSTKYLTTLIF